jgi:hypothetical protein
MFLAIEELTPLTAMNQGVSVRYSSGLVEPLPICFSHKQACAGLTVTNP